MLMWLTCFSFKIPCMCMNITAYILPSTNLYFANINANNTMYERFASSVDLRADVDVVLLLGETDHVYDDDDGGCTATTLKTLFQLLLS